MTDQHDRGSSTARGDGGTAGERPTGAAGSVDRPGTGAVAGTVYLVGAGPGDPDLLTRRAWRLLAEADVVMHDSLTSDALLSEVPAGVDLRDVGKRPPDRTDQSTINDMLVERARDDDAVVRLKGGDPTVFGRGGEEAQHCAAAGVAVELVPGVSSVLAAPAAAGVPLTHREHAASVTVVTGHETPDRDGSALDWAALADTVVAGGTLVVLMGVRTLERNVTALRDHGVPGDTGLAVVQKATWREEAVVETTLAEAPAAVADADVEPPAVTVVGDVVDVRESVVDQLR